MKDYSQLMEYAKNYLKLYQDTSFAEIARMYLSVNPNLTQTPEQLRKVLSREFNKTTKPNNKLKEAVKKHKKYTINDTMIGSRDSRGLVTFEEVGNYGTATFTFETAPSTEPKVRKQNFTTPGSYILLGCVHVPGHNQSMINGITKLIPDLKDLKGLMLMGDFLDMNTLSFHDKGKFTAIPGLTLDEEYKQGNVVLDQLTNQLPKGIEKVFLFGNHEHRWNRYMGDMQNAKAPILSPTEALKLEERGFNVFTNWSSDYVKLGSHLELIHGQYYNTHCAKQHIDKFRGSVAFCHTHRIQMYVEGSTGGFNIGWGGDVSHPFFNYAERGTKGQWQNGFAICNIDEKGDYFMQQIFHYNNKFYFNGKVYN